MFEHVYQSGYLTSLEQESHAFAKQLIRQLEGPDFESYFGIAVETFDTMIISDIHLGSKVSRTRKLIELLTSVRFKRLIINGDVFDSINMRRLNKEHWQVLSLLRKLTNSKSDHEVIWIRGNHDGYSDLLTQLLGIKIYNEYLFSIAGKKALTLHGDIFDSFTSRFPLVSDIADYLYRLSFYVDPIKMRFSRWLKRNSKTFIRNTVKVRERAMAYARHRQADYVICGHTHHADEYQEGNITYLNCGCWTEAPSHFVGIVGEQIRVIPY
ncbi:UDP-2,3-diacylglucosamine diphosphatase [Caldithrix abyssi]